MAEFDKCTDPNCRHRLSRHAHVRKENAMGNPNFVNDWQRYQAWVMSRVNVQKRKITGTADEPMAHIATLGFMGLAFEAGEVGDLGKKYILHGKPVDRDKLKEEMGDVLWYFALLCQYYDFDFGDILSKNQEKLEARDGKSGEKFLQSRGIEGGNGGY